MKIYLTIIFILLSCFTTHSQLLQTKWEYYHLASKSNTEFNYGRKILAYLNKNEVYFVLERGDSVPMFIGLDSIGRIKYKYLYVPELILFGQNRTTRLAN